MKRISELALVLAVGAAAGCGRANPDAAAPAEEAPVADKPPPGAAWGPEVPPALADVFKERDKLHKRQTGALLTITARWEEQPGLAPGVRIDWAIDYDGPRSPFTIVSPALSAWAAGQTTVYFWYMGADGKPAGFE